MTRFAILAAPGRRVEGFCAAAAAAELPPPQFVSYDAFVRDEDCLRRALAASDVLRVDSPGGDAAAYRLFAGATGRPDEVGRIDPPVPFQLGLPRVLSNADRLAREAGVVQLTDAPTVAALFDKAVCHERFCAGGVPVPARLSADGGFDALRATLREAGLRRAFVKLRYGSGGSGVAAVELFGDRVRAWSATEIAADGHLYTVRRVVRHLDRDAVRLLDALAPLGVHVEAWVPKLKLGGELCDLRLLMVGGEPAHMVGRLSRTPITNLHLRNRRVMADDLRPALSPAMWERIADTGRRAAALFPAQFCLALDIAVHEDGRQIFVLEGNAFGDELRGVTHNGLDTYAYQIARLSGWGRTRCAA